MANGEMKTLLPAGKTYLPANGFCVRAAKLLLKEKSAALLLTN